MYHGLFSSEPKLFSEISRRLEHITTSIGYVKKVYGKANLQARRVALVLFRIPKDQNLLRTFRPMIGYFINKNEIFSKRVFC